MAHCTISNGIETITGSLKKTTEQGVNHITVTKKKHFRDPLTTDEPCKQFPNFVRAVLASEKRKGGAR